jgi:hypothetical protein
MHRIIESERKMMTDREYTAYVLSESGKWGNSVSFWIRSNDPKEAGQRARQAARLALKVLGREEAR